MMPTSLQVRFGRRRYDRNNGRANPEMSAMDQSVLGPAWPAMGWVPAPRYLLRRDRVVRQVASWKPGRLLEIGCGAGALLHEFAGAGFDCTGLETSAQALNLARRIRDSEECRIDFRDSAASDWDHAFDAVVALEVLEHIPDDADALRAWSAWMKPTATLLVSVPAHRARWGPADEWAGHVRRYDRRDIVRVLEIAGFCVEQVECYGFPLGNTLDRASRKRYENAIIRDCEGAPDREANNDRSGVDRRNTERLYDVIATMPGRWLMRSACWLQDKFVGTELGTGFIVTARKQ